MSVDFEYDENMGNPPQAEGFLSLEVDNNFYIATERALPWREPEDAPGDRMVVAGAFIESLLRKAPVANVGSWDNDEATAQRQERLRNNPKKVFYYDDGGFSIKKTLFDWHGICRKFSWDPDKLCGPVTMNSTTIDKNRAHNCMDSDHRNFCDHHRPPRADGKIFKPRDHMRELTKEGLISYPEQLKGAEANGFSPPGTSKAEGGRTVYEHFA